LFCWGFRLAGLAVRAFALRFVFLRRFRSGAGGISAGCFDGLAGLAVFSFVSGYMLGLFCIWLCVGSLFGRKLILFFSAHEI
jgi:predicted cobalt transporter CbtA